jgi:hypothetical protein
MAASGEEAVSSQEPTPPPPLVIQALRGQHKIIGSAKARKDCSQGWSFKVEIEDDGVRYKTVEASWDDFKEATPELFEAISQFASEHCKDVNGNTDEDQKETFINNLLAARIRPGLTRKRKFTGTDIEEEEAMAVKEKHKRRRYLFYRDIANKAGWKELTKMPDYIQQAVHTIWPDPAGEYRGHKED